MRAAKDPVFFASAQTAVLRCKTRRLWLCRWRSDPAPMSPLRAVVSRGHITGNLLSAVSYSEGHPKTWPLPRRLFPNPRSRRLQSAKTLFRTGLSDSPAMSPLAHHARPHRSPTPDRSCLTSHSRPDRLTTCTATTRAGSQRLLVFRYDTNGGAPLQNPKTLSLPVAIRYRPRCRRCEP